MDRRGRGSGEGRVERNSKRPYEQRQAQKRDEIRAKLESVIQRKKSQQANLWRMIEDTRQKKYEAASRKQTKRLESLRNKEMDLVRKSNNITSEIEDVRKKIDNLY